MPGRMGQEGREDGRTGDGKHQAYWFIVGTQERVDYLVKIGHKCSVYGDNW